MGSKCQYPLSLLLIGFCCMTISFCSSSHQLIDIWIIFTCFCQVCGALFSFSLGTYLGVLLLAFMISLCLTF